MRLETRTEDRRARTRFLAPIFAVALAFGACSRTDTGSRTQAGPGVASEQNRTLAAANEELTTKLKEAEASDAEASATLAEVQASLEEIRGKELKILKKTLDVTREGQARTTTRERLTEEIGTIRDAIRKNLDRIARLEHERKADGRKMASMQTLVDELKRSLEEKSTTIATLEKTVGELNGKVREQEGVILAKDTLIREKDETIASRTRQMNTAFVAVAGKKVLKQKGLVEKKGSVLGLGGAWQETGKFDPEVFRVIDTTAEAELTIPAPAAKVRLLPGHPEESYRIVSGGPATSTLKVTDRDAFWRDSRYLVVMIPD
jgi:chromosome segregation ATPase